MKRNFLLLLFAVVTFVSQATQTRFFVRETGVDNYETTGTESDPFKTINYALTKCALTGDTIDVLGVILTADSLGTVNTPIAINNGKGVTIIGHGTENTFIQPASTKGESNNRVFTFADADKIVIKDLTIRWGNVVSLSNQTGANINSWQTEFELDNVVVTGGTAKTGGGIHIQGTNNKFVVIRNSVISDNTAELYGGGISTGGTGSQGSKLEIHKSLIAYNKLTSTASARGGGLYFDSYQSQPCEYAVYNSTIAFNETPTANAAFGSSFNTTAPVRVTMWNNTIAYNEAHAQTDITNVTGAGAYFPAKTPNFTFDLLNNLFMENIGKAWGKTPDFYDVNLNGPTLERVSYNIFTNNMPDYYIHKPYNSQPDSDPGKTNIYNGNTLVKLATELANNGGPTQTLAIATGSSAINAGQFNPLPFMSTDQRGFSRDLSTDIGAFEFIDFTSTAKALFNKNDVFYDFSTNQIIAKNDGFNLEVYNLTGVCVLKKELTGNSINVSELSPGQIYIAVVKWSDLGITTFKFKR
jgi:hypothetical protein